MHLCVVSKYIHMPSNCICMLLNFQGRQVCLQNAMVYFQSTFAYDWNKLVCIRTLRMHSYAFKTYSYTLKNICMVSIYFSSYTFLHSYAIVCQINISPLVNWTPPPPSRTPTPSFIYYSKYFFTPLPKLTISIQLFQYRNFNKYV